MSRSCIRNDDNQMKQIDSVKRPFLGHSTDLYRRRWNSRPLERRRGAAAWRSKIRPVCRLTVSDSGGLAGDVRRGNLCRAAFHPTYPSAITSRISGSITSVQLCAGGFGPADRTGPRRPDQDRVRCGSAIRVFHALPSRSFTTSRAWYPLSAHGGWNAQCTDDVPARALAQPHFSCPPGEIKKGSTVQ